MLFFLVPGRQPKRVDPARAFLLGYRDGGVLVEHVISGTNGYIVSCPDELTMRLRQLASDRELRLRLGTAGRQYVTRKYSYDNLVASYDGLYDLLLSR